MTLTMSGYSLNRALPIKVLPECVHLSFLFISLLSPGGATVDAQGFHR